MKTFFQAPCKLLLISILPYFCLSCETDKKDVAPVEESKPAFSDKQWKTRTWTLDVPLDMDDDGVKDTDLLPFLDECDHDDFLIFQKDGKLMADSGTEHCKADEKQRVHASNWTYDETTKIITMKYVSDGAEKDKWKVLAISDDVLKVSFDILPDDGKSTPLKSTMTFKRF